MLNQDFLLVVHPSSQNDKMEIVQASSFKRQTEIMQYEKRWGRTGIGWGGLEEQGLLVPQEHGGYLCEKSPAYQGPFSLSQQGHFQASSTGNTRSWIMLLSTSVALAIASFLCSFFWSRMDVFLTHLEALLRSSWVLFQVHVISLTNEFLLPYEDA